MEVLRGCVGLRVSAAVLGLGQGNKLQLGGNRASVLRFGQVLVMLLLLAAGCLLAAVAGWWHLLHVGCC